MRRFVSRTTALFSLALLAALPAIAESDTCEKCNPDREWLSYWKFQVTPYVWMFFIDGDIGAAGKKTSVSANFTDLFKHTDSVLGLELNMQAQNGPWTVVVDPTWLRATASTSFDRGPLRVKGDATADYVLLDALVMREALRWSWRDANAAPAEPDRYASIDLLGGMRSTILVGDFNVKVNVPNDFTREVQRQLDQTQSWVDPVVGARATLDLGRFTLGVRGDIGGFTLVSDLTSEMWASAAYKFKLFGLDAFTGAAFRAVYDDYDANNGFLYKTWIYGPVIGMGFRF